MSSTVLGPYVVGEIPEPWIEQFLDFDGAVINITGFTVRITYRLRTTPNNIGSQVLRNGALVDAANGKASYSWVASDLVSEGILEGEMTVGNGTLRLVRPFVMSVDAPRGGPIPAV